ncbi:MAG: hypothetical protein KUG77_09060 [Nannocystaceae bacterium]|nr:hypothetical protein [Nannocystaceae bacterium]
MADAPSGWEDGSPDAVARAEEWAEALGGSVDDVFSTRSDDGFAETLALLSLPIAMSPGAELNPERALEQAVGSLFESEPASPRLLEGTQGAPIVTGVWTEDGVVYEVAVVSGGAKQGVVFLAVRESESSLYAKVFDDAVESIVGAAPPLSPFKVGPWRTGSLIGWVLVLVIGWLFIGSTGVREDGAAAIGRSVAVLCILLSVVAGSVVYIMLIDDAGPLRLASLSRSRVALEVAGGGSLAALLAWFLGALRDGTVRRVESAPAGRGTFSGSARTLGPNLVPPSRPAALTDPGHGMSQAELGRVDKEVVRQPLQTLVGAPSLAAASSDDAFDKVWAEAQAAAEAAVDKEDEVLGRADDTPKAESHPGSDAPTKAPVKHESTVVGPAPAPAQAPRTKTKTKTAALQFPPPMSDDS